MRRNPSRRNIEDRERADGAVKCKAMDAAGIGRKDSSRKFGIAVKFEDIFDNVLCSFCRITAAHDETAVRDTLVIAIQFFL